MSNNNPFGTNTDDNDDDEQVMNLLLDSPLNSTMAAARLQHTSSSDAGNSTSSTTASNMNHHPSVGSNEGDSNRNFTAFQANFAAKIQDHTAKRSGSLGNLAGSSMPSANGSATHGFTNNTYKAPMHEDEISQQHDFTVYPTHTGGPNRNGKNGYMYLNNQQSKFDNAHTMSVDYNLSNTAYMHDEYGALDYLRELCNDFCGSCQDFVASLPRWFKLGASAFMFLWICIVLAHRHYHNSQNSNNSKGDSDNTDNGGNGSNNTTISTRNKNVLSHNCVDVGNYYFGDAVLEYNGHSYQIVGFSGEDSDISETGSTMLSFFDGLLHARMRCLNGHNGYLAVIDSEEENSFIASKVFEYSKRSESNSTTVARVWLGGNDMNNSGEFQWLSANSDSDGKVFWRYRQNVSGVFSNFGTRDDQPQNNSDRHCVYMHVTKDAMTNGLWWDNNCYVRIGVAVIEYDALLVPPKEL